ncbi:MAG: hypothetical protein J5I93_26690 [Pirellulaceae bacterium]|nr:hypothetical protein [Pirellulaceae bacterium]
MVELTSGDVIRFPMEVPADAMRMQVVLQQADLGSSNLAALEQATGQLSAAVTGLAGRDLEVELRCSRAGAALAGLLARTIRPVRSQGGRLRITTGASHVREVLLLCGLGPWLV